MGAKKSKLTVALVLFIVVFLPLGSIFYLNRGFNYHKAIWENMKSYGKVSNLNFSINSTEKPIETKILKGGISLVGFYNDANEAKFLDLFSTFYDQFKKDQTLFVGIDMDGDFDATATLDKYKLPRFKYFILADGQKEGVDLINEIKWPSIEKPKLESGLYELTTPTADQIANYPYILLFDEYGELRNYFKWETREDLDKIIEQTAILITHHELGDKKEEEVE